MANGQVEVLVRGVALFDGYFLRQTAQTIYAGLPIDVDRVFLHLSTNLRILVAFLAENCIT